MVSLVRTKVCKKKKCHEYLTMCTFDLLVWHIVGMSYAHYVVPAYQHALKGPFSMEARRERVRKYYPVKQWLPATLITR